MIKYFIVIFIFLVGTSNCFSQTNYELNTITLEYRIPNDFLKEFKIEIRNPNYYKKLTSELEVIITKYNSKLEKVTFSKKVPLKIYREIETEFFKINQREILLSPIISNDGGIYIFKIESLSGEIIYRFSDVDSYENSEHKSLNKILDYLVKFLDSN